MTDTSQIYINIPIKNSLISFLNSYPDLNSEIVKKPDNSRYADGIDTGLVFLRRIVFFSIFTS